MLPSMPLLFAQSQDCDMIEQPNKVQAVAIPDIISPEPKDIMSPKEEFIQEKLCVIENDIPSMTFDSIPEDEKECDDELVLIAENSSFGEKRKILPQSAPTRKKRKVEPVELLLEDRNSNDEQANHFATAYFMKAKAELDEPSFQKFISLLSGVNEESTDPISLYQEMTELLSGYPDLAEEFIGFLHPHQALEVDKFAEFTQFDNIWNFFRKLDGFHLNKVNHLIEQHSTNSEATHDTIRTSFLSAFKGHPNISEGFLSLLPDERPLPSCKEEYEEIPDLSADDAGYERLKVPEPRDRGCTPNDCDCICHSSLTKRFCTFCNIKFSKGQIYVHTGKGLRFAKVSFRGSQDEVVSRLQPITFDVKPTIRKRTKSCGNHNNKENIPVENGPILKEMDVVLKPEEPKEEADPQMEERGEVLKEDEEEEEVSEEEKTEEPWEEGKVSELSSESSESLFGSIEEEASDHDHHLSDSQVNEVKNDEPSSSIKLESQVSTSTQLVEENINKPEEPDGKVSSMEEKGVSKEANVEDKKREEGEKGEGKIEEERMWTREEDKMILQAFQRELSAEQTFSKISNLMPSRTVNDIQTRFQVLMNLLEQMTSGAHDNYPA